MPNRHEPAVIADAERPRVLRAPPRHHQPMSHPGRPEQRCTGQQLDAS
jgi:hypothetical protein